MQALIAMVKAVADSNESSHELIITNLRDMETRLCAKITLHTEAIEAIEARCITRKEECVLILDQRKQMFEAEISDAKDAAVLQAREPSVYWRATRGVAGTILKLAAAASLMVGVALGIVTLMGLL